MVRTIGMVVVMGVAVMGAMSTPAWGHDGHHHEGDFVVSRTAGNQVALEGPFDEVIHAEVSEGPLSGWVASDPGFAAIGADEPDEGFFMLDTDASIWLEVVSLDAGLKVWQSDAGAVAAAPGQRILLGGQALHSHVFWHIDSSAAGIGPDWTGTLGGTFRLVDTGETAYAASEPFHAQVTNVPEPMSLGLLGLSAMMLWRRRPA